MQQATRRLCDRPTHQRGHSSCYAKTRLINPKLITHYASRITPMRPHLEALARQEEAARLSRLATDRASDPRGYARADAAWHAAHRQLVAAVHEAIRETG